MVKKETGEENMKSVNAFVIDSFRFILVIFFFSFYGLAIGQITNSISDTSIYRLQFSLSEIPNEFSKSSNQLIEISKVSSENPKITNNDSIVKHYLTKLTIEHENLIGSKSSKTYQGLERLNRAWHNYKNKFSNYHQILNHRIQEIESSKLLLEQELKKWEVVSIELSYSNLPREYTLYTDSALSFAETDLSVLNERYDKLLRMKSRNNQLNLLIDKTIRLLEEEQLAFQSNYFILDSRPIWSSSDSTIQIENLKSYLRTETNESYQNLKEYLLSNRGIVFIQFLFVISLIIGFIFLRRIWTIDKLDENNKRELQAGFVIRHPFFSSLILSIVVSVFFYSNRPQVLVSFFVLLMVLSSFILLPGLISKKIRSTLLLLLILYIINIFQAFLPYTSLANRIGNLFLSIASLYIVLIAYRMRNEFNMKRQGKRIYLVLIRIFTTLLIIAFIANIIGSVKLGDFLISSTIRTLNFSIISLTIVIIMNSMAVLLIKAKQTQSIPLYEDLKSLIDKRIRPLINWIGFLLWLFATLVYFRLLKPVENIIEHLMNFELPIASITISVGGIVSFLLIIFVTYFIVRLIKSISNEDIISHKLPKGSIDAVSMIIRYIVVAIGVYLALGALGVSMSKLGFILGALGVGIGFGLQNIVLNFIAGLILNIERPLHIGDIIEVDQYMGRITNIGVRASHLLTFDGSEVIVPNGLLISNKVVNWTHSNERRRLVINFKTPIEADPLKVVEILSHVAVEHKNILKDPKPMSVFNGEDQFHLSFTLYCWVDFSNGLSTKSELHIQGKKALEANGIKAPIPVFISHLETNKQNKEQKK
jgi:potassium efflux system protein